jgi:uncharacterized protein
LVSGILRKMVLYFGNDIKRVNHAIKVHGYAKVICGNEYVSEMDNTIIELSAVLHDIGIPLAEKKYNSSSGKYQELEGPPVAKEILIDSGVEKSIIERVCYLIGNHHSYSKIDGVDFQILVEADFIVNIEEDALDLETIKGIKEKYFKTAVGKEILYSLYGI